MPGKKQNNNRRFSGGGPRPDKTEQKRKDAEIMRARWARLSVKDKLSLIESRRGESMKERAKLMVQMETEL